MKAALTAIAVALGFLALVANITGSPVFAVILGVAGAVAAGLRLACLRRGGTR